MGGVFFEATLGFLGALAGPLLDAAHELIPVAFGDIHVVFGHVARLRSTWPSS